MASGNAVGLATLNIAEYEGIAGSEYGGLLRLITTVLCIGGGTGGGAQPPPQLSAYRGLAALAPPPTGAAK